MKFHDLAVHPESRRLSRKQQLARRLAQVAAEPVLEPAVEEMIINRIIDNAGVAIAAIDRRPVASARAMALAHPRDGGATLFSLDPQVRVCAEWAAWANGTAVCELDVHDTFLATDDSHPGDNIPPLLAVAQQRGKDGRALLRAIATGYEVQVDMVKAICLHRHKINHNAHLGPSVAAAIGTLLELPPEVIHQSIQQALHCTITTRQSRKRAISFWKAYAPTHAGNTAIEAVVRCMRGEAAPSPIYQGEDSIVARTGASGETIVGELAVANAHPLGRRPFGRTEYIGKFRTLTDGRHLPCQGWPEADDLQYPMSHQSRESVACIGP
jgi:2-methylcitrate dehydratase